MLAKLELINRLTENGVVAVIRNIPKEKIMKVAESLIEGGVHALEVTLDGDDPLIMIEDLTTEFQDRAIIGAGTVLDEMSAERAIGSGAQFIVSPILKKEVIQATRRHGKVSIPGVMTPTEMVEAIEWGADIVKVFPASVGGLEFIKNVKGPLPHIPIIPTGGVDAHNAADFIKAGAIAIGAGGNLVDRKAVLEEDYAKLTAMAKEYVSTVKTAREMKK
ncbi:2-dehydro-3-deoxyphosphogluconate aldolase/(4S)-4-hydroxy-2-oxoglutarate aldolase [Virgibacillus natechei]|uniref:2-dehydro-3-deoxyphosphogluconate aldolase/(4S)-4-hydroxy-2-oxoglutarate aldolase n=2 Tax=Virgibacillus natechei TaxID=1216297 RepID=A0ABS4IEE4_9BACI|nr:bifunctional 4-hydroxy-2-oxoglutarate aldolase/2-dehydro-3-deoxy-phosphogluconate aldolase [Virgibacillus natechei]MBP1969322.1 2-dehydro-3-deoxyphosphogluconate aldolase/(4S)-4-hydroxy-2-oxoglutarate aldolase [Virgibacillus natechei]UZD14976.1 bifunctional 4-hydroxy-2-oxoglutarate aldolase/2-dehydro-3-deoxy-phosphogluconate aldolase [Virgibacillus natechei]